MDSMALVATCSATRSPVRERVCRFCSGSVVSACVWLIYAMKCEDLAVTLEQLGRDRAVSVIRLL